MMHMCSGLVVPKSGNNEKPLVFNCFLKGQEGHGHHRKNNNRVGRGSFWSIKQQTNDEKESKTATRREMASMVHVCSGLVVPKSGNAEKPLVLNVF